MRHFTPIILILFLTPQLSVSAYGISGSYQDLSQNEVNFDKFQGKPLFIEAFATWCTHCQNQHSVLVELNKKYNSSFQMLSLSISTKDSFDKINDYLQKYPSPWYIGFDNTDKFKQQFQIQGFPTMIIFDDEGNFASCFTGERSYHDLSNEFNDFLKSPQQYIENNSNNGVCQPLETSNLFSSSIFTITAILTLGLIITTIVNAIKSRKNIDKFT